MPPGPTSSNDLILEMIREVISERQRDQADGLTLRSVQRSVESHASRDDKVHEAIEKRLRELEDAKSRAEGHEIGTGRYQIPAYPPLVLPVAAKSKRPSLPPWLSPKSPIVQWAAIALLGLAHVLSRAGCGVAVSPPAPAVSTAK